MDMSNISIKFKVIRESGRQKLFLIPYLFTFANAIFGLLAVISALENRYSVASVYILCAALMDFIDGKLARALKTTSYLGMELDSLSDAISFCFAPTIVLYCWYIHRLGTYGIFVLALYICSGIYRLARFNVSNNIQLNYFTGLPTTAAACCVAVLVISGSFLDLIIVPTILQRYGVVSFVALMSLLMVSHIYVPSWKDN
jgi:CDP-diacylglycerol--serine O-phosphatidyltransferase